MAETPSPSFRADPCDVAGIMLIGLKLEGIIDWPWALVFAPLYIPLVMVVIGFLVALVILMIRGR